MNPERPESTTVPPSRLGPTRADRITLGSASRAGDGLRRQSGTYPWGRDTTPRCYDSGRLNLFRGQKFTAGTTSISTPDAQIGLRARNWLQKGSIVTMLSTARVERPTAGSGTSANRWRE